MRHMHKCENDYMKFVNEAMIKVVSLPSQRMTKSKARKILKNCGILDNENRLKDVYKSMIIYNQGGD